MANSKIRTPTSQKVILQDKFFKLGFNDARMGYRFRDEYEKFCTRDQCRYEIGRLVGTVHKGPAHMANLLKTVADNLDAIQTTKYRRAA